MLHSRLSLKTCFLSCDANVREPFRWSVSCLLALLVGALIVPEGHAEQLRAGAAKIDISRVEEGPLESPLFAKALVIKSDATTVVLVTLDVVSFGEIGYIPNDFIQKVRSRAQKELGLKPEHIMFNASHCHGAPSKDVEARTFQVIKQAAAKLVPVRVGVGVGREDRVMENRRMFLKNGKEIDVRQAYSLPPDEEIAGVVPTESTGGRLTNSICLDSCTQWLSVSQTSRVIWCVPSDRQAEDSEFDSKTEPFPLISPHALNRSPSILLVHEYDNSSRSRSHELDALNETALPLANTSSSRGESQRMNGG